jgi:hypothetical protein
MNLYKIEHTELQFEQTKKCLKKINISIDYNDLKNHIYIGQMSEYGDNICPPGARKFWHFLKTLEERNTSYTGNPNRPEKMAYILVNNSQCLLNKISKPTEYKDLLGLWNDSLIWRKDSKDTCWHGLKTIDKQVQLKLNPTNTYIWKEKFKDSQYNHTEIGECFLTREGGLTNLSLMINYSEDTLYEFKDTMVGRIFNLYWPDSTRILLVEKLSNETSEYPDAYEFLIKRY